MADLDKLTQDATTRALISAGRDAARRAASDLLSSDEERAADEAARARASKKKRNKLIVFGVLGLFVLIGVVGLLLSYWHWFLALGLVGFGGWFAWRRVRKRRALEPAVEAKRIETAAVVTTKRIEEEPRETEAEARERDARARAEARAILEQETDEELAALKARMSK
jgi:biopolymer transport protein ExbB/TolQ